MTCPVAPQLDLRKVCMELLLGNSFFQAKTNIFAKIHK